MEYKFLRFVEYIKLSFWDTKRYAKKTISSKFEIIELFQCIEEQNKIYKLPEEEKEYGILGVNNKEGIFDAYLQKGKEINQPYKKMEVDWIAYNPYRINVGSIGIRLKEHLNEYISPAYVVFSCLNNLKPEYLFLMFKTPTFNNIINESTTGSVRQNLTFETLKNIQIPLPSLEEQEAIVSAYQSKIEEAQRLENEAQELENEIENYLFEELGIEQEQQKKGKIRGLQFVEFKNLDRWDGRKNDDISSIYPIYSIGKYITSISTGTTPPTNRKEYFDGDINFYTPAELGNEMYLKNSERKISELAFVDRKARRFERGTILFVGIGSTVGKVGIIENEYASSNQQITGFIVDNGKLNNEYVYYYFNHFKQITVKEQTKATLPIVNQEKITNISIPIPPLPKQNEIAATIATMKQTQKQKTETATRLRAEALAEFEQVIFS